MSILNKGTVLNRNQYRITKFIGQGGFGITYMAEEIGYFRRTGFGEEYVPAKNPDTVIVKELYYGDYCNRNEMTGLVTISNNEKKVEFEKLVKNQIDEGKTIKSLNHPNIVRTRDIFEENSTAYMVMDFIESTDLEEILKRSGSLEKERAMKYILQILDAADYIHTKTDKKILHLDISPSNILIDKHNDNAILIDFGSALSYDKMQNRITSTTSQIVTGRKKHYSPNEQGDIDNLKEFDATFDTYAVGATLYHLLSGEKPPLSSLVSSGREKIYPPSQFGKDTSITDYLDTVIIKSIAPWYPDRYSNASAFEQALRKENEYAKRINEINRLLTDKRISDALERIKDTKQYFLETPTLLRLETELKEEVGKEKKQKEYDLFVKQGIDFLLNDNYKQALSSFNKAKAVFPENTDLDDKLDVCKQKIHDEEIRIYIKQAEDFLNRDNFEKANEYINLANDLESGNSDVDRIRKAIETKENGANLNTARTAFEKGNYAEARKLLGLIFAVDKFHQGAKTLERDIAEAEKDKQTEIVQKKTDKENITVFSGQDNTTGDNSKKTSKSMMIWAPVGGLIIIIAIVAIVFVNTNSEIDRNLDPIDTASVSPKNYLKISDKDSGSVGLKETPEKIQAVPIQKIEEESKIDWATYNKKMTSVRKQIALMNSGTFDQSIKDAFRVDIVNKLYEALKAKPNDDKAKRLLGDYEK